HAPETRLHRRRAPRRSRLDLHQIAWSSTAVSGILQRQSYVAVQPAGRHHVQQRAPQVALDLPDCAALITRLISQALVDEGVRRGTELVAVLEPVLVTVLHGLATPSAGLDLQRALCRVQVTSGADLETHPATVRVTVVGQQIGGVEVDGLVVE